MKISIVLYPGFETLDVLGPYQVFAHARGLEVRFVAERAGLRIAGDQFDLEADVGFGDCLDPDVVIVPGGRTAPPMAGAGQPLVKWLRTVHTHTTWTASVGTGAVLLDAAGVLRGRSASVTKPGLVIDGRVITVDDSAGIELGLAILARIPAATFHMDPERVQRRSRVDSGDRRQRNALELRPATTASLA